MTINSLLDTDFYKITMMQAVYHKYTNVNVEYAFKWRNKHKCEFTIPINYFIYKIQKEINHLCTLRFQNDELDYLAKIPFIKKDFIEFLRIFQLNKNHVVIERGDCDSIDIRIKGPWLNTILFEVPILAIISELYTIQINDHTNQKNYYLGAVNKLNEKIWYLNNPAQCPEGFRFGDFGTRRRMSFEFQKRMLIEMIKTGKLIGTSNVHFAKLFGIKPLGTHAHEWFQVHQQLNHRLIDSQKAALQAWADEYRGELGIALSDCITFDAFLVDFDKYFAKLFDGCRHDSGNPYKWVEKLINHYKKMNIDPRTKTALFSDGLELRLAVDLYNRYNAKINTSFGIGTNLTNDAGFTAPQIVLKLVKVNGQPVAKISDSPGKGMCEDAEYLSYLMRVIIQKTGNNGFL